MQPDAPARNSHRPLILASASPRRLALLAQIGLVPDRVLVPGVDETPHHDELPRQYAGRIARTKADMAWNQVAQADPASHALVLAADTVVAAGRRILPKAETEAEARGCLALLSGRRHRVITAVVLRHAAGQTERVVESVVAFARLTARQIDSLIAAGDWQGKAGGYAVQGHAAASIRYLSGSYSNVVGLPLFETAQLLRTHSVLP